MHHQPLDYVKSVQCHISKYCNLNYMQTAKPLVHLNEFELSLFLSLLHAAFRILSISLYLSFPFIHFSSSNLIAPKYSFNVTHIQRHICRVWQTKMDKMMMTMKKNGVRQMECDKLLA